VRQKQGVFKVHSSNFFFESKIFNKKFVFFLYLPKGAESNFKKTFRMNVGVLDLSKKVI
jgi:hypothetical protein